MYGRVIEFPTTAAFHEGKSAGIKEGINKGITKEREQSIQNVMESLGCSREKAMEVLQIK